jgi:hypothetical protein
MSDSPSYFYYPNAFSIRNEKLIFEQLQIIADKKCALAKVSEYLDLQQYTQKRSVHKCRCFYNSYVKPPFEFAVCMN